MSSPMPLFAFLVVFSVIASAFAGMDMMDDDMKKMAGDIQAKMCTAKPEQIEASDKCDPPGFATVHQKCMKKVLNAQTSHEAVKKLCTDKEKSMTALKTKMRPCIGEEMQNNPPSPDQQAKMQKMMEMEPEKRKAMMKEHGKKVMQCKMTALSS